MTTALITGASSGIAKACAIELAKHHNVVICSRDEGRIRKAAEDIPKGNCVWYMAADVSRKEDLNRLYKFAVEKCGGVDVLVNNSGGPAPGSHDQVTDEQWEHAYAETLMSIVHMTNLVLPLMKKQKFGRIINVTSCSVYEPIPRLLLSNTFRPAIAGFSKSVSNEVAEFGITINNILPGTIHTGRHEMRVADIMKNTGKTKKQVVEEMEAQIPMKRMGDPAELAAMVAFLASPQAGYITGTNIQIDGGRLKGW